MLKMTNCKIKFPLNKPLSQPWLCTLLSTVMISCLPMAPSLAFAADYNFVTEDSRDFYTVTSVGQIAGDYLVTDNGDVVPTGGVVINKVTYPDITAPTTPSINYPTYTQPGVPSITAIATQNVAANTGNISVSQSNAQRTDTGSSYTGDTMPDLWLNDTSITYNHFTLPDKVVEADGSIGRLTIDKLGLSVKVYEEESMESMSRGIGHFKSTSCWDGNIGLAGHNRGVNTHFGSLKKLTNGDILEYETKLGIRRYEVFYSGRIGATDFTRLERSDTNMLTLITCVENKPDLRYCVQAKQI